MRASRPTAPDVVMVLENCTYPLDARVRMEAETLLASGRSVEVLAPRGRGEAAREVIRGVSVRRLPVPDGEGRLLGTALEYLVALIVFSAATLVRLARSRSGVLHVHNPPDLFFALLWIARLRGWSTVFDHHDDAAGMMRAKLGSSGLPVSTLAWMRDRSAEAADLTIATNDTQAELLRGRARRVAVVRNSPPTWFAEHSPQPPEGRRRLVFLGEIGAQDRVERAVEVLCALLEEPGMDVELLVVGDGPRRASVEERAVQLGVRSRVTVTGWVPFEEVPELLASAHVGLDTAPATEVNEGSTMVKILEYLAVGLPVVATSLHETRVTGKDAVALVEEDSAEAFVAPLSALLGSEQSWVTGAERARRRGGELLWPAQAETLLSAYRGLARP